MNQIRVLWADDQANVRETLAHLLGGIAESIVHAADGHAAIEMLSKETFDILILDLKMPPDEWGGLWLLKELKQRGIDVPTLVLSGEGTQMETIRALREGAADYVTKDKANQELASRVKSVLDGLGPTRRLLHLIEAGEGSDFECKETLRWNIRASKNDKSIEHAVAKTIAAFANTSGGTLAVGVSDSGVPVGLQHDGFPNRDAALRHLDNLMNSFLGNAAATLVRSRFVAIEGRDVLRIDCRRSPFPVYVSGLSGEPEFYVRRQASSVKLKVDEAVLYIRTEFDRT